MTISNFLQDDYITMIQVNRSFSQPNLWDNILLGVDIKMCVTEIYVALMNLKLAQDR